MVTDGGARQSLTLLHGLKDLDCHIAVLCSSKLDVCYASNIPHEKILLPHAAGSDADFEATLLELLRKGDYDVLLPVAEMTTNKVTLHEDEYRQYTRLACAPRAAYIQAGDKQLTFEHAANIGMPAPKTRRLGQTVDDFLSLVEFPLIIKPRTGMGSIGFHKFKRREDFYPYVEEHGIDLDKYVLQEFVKHEKRLGTILFVDRDGQVCMQYADEVLRWYPLDAGTASLIRSIDAPQLLADSSRLLQAMQWQGVAALSFMVEEETGTAKLLEINGRIPASIKLSWQCGFNVAKLLVQMAMEEKVDAYPPNTVFGQCTRHFLAEIPWVFKSPDRFRSRPSWFSWKNTSDVVCWSGDPKPAMAYAVRKMVGYKESMNKRRH